jgi:hypothetical protein
LNTRRNREDRIHGGLLTDRPILCEDWNLPDAACNTPQRRLDYVGDGEDGYV